MFTLEQLQETHQNYKDVAKAANYHYASYAGGATYRAGEYLTKYIGEESAPGDQYAKRLMATPLDNHVQTTVDIYRSFLFRSLPKRELGTLANNPLVYDWLHDTDQEGQGMDSFLKTANDLAMITGACWILVDKASYKVETQAQEVELGIRAYAATYSPQNVLDWYYERNIAGKPILHYIKVKETENAEYVCYTCWYTDKVCKYTVSKNEQGEYLQITSYEEYENPLGEVPFVYHAPVKSPVRGVGVSLVADVANQQRFIYNCLSEIEQHLRISSHPTLVKTPSTDANAGAGGIIQIQEDMDPGHKPYLLQPTLTTTDSILKTIENSVAAIKRMTHTSAIQATTGSPMSGVALQTERQLLNAKLTDMADTLRETELAMWELWLKWQALTMPEDFHIEYPETFDMRDEHLELDFLMKARASGVSSAAYQTEIDRQIVALTVDDSEIQTEILASMDQQVFEPVVMILERTGETVTARDENEKVALLSNGFVQLGTT
jgi:hypothetical protein